MFVDYLTLMLVNLVAGLAIMALFVFRYLDSDRKKMAPGLLASGAVAVVSGFRMTFTWPIPGSYNIAFGEMTLLFGVLLLGLALALLFEWDLLTLGIYAIFAGAASILIGTRIMNLRMTNEPLLAGGGFILTGLAGVLSLPVYFLRKRPVVRILAAILLLGCAAIWAVVGSLAYWGHLEAFSKWAPVGNK
jgi:putative membrane protein